MAVTVNSVHSTLSEPLLQEDSSEADSEQLPEQPQEAKPRSSRVTVRILENAGEFDLLSDSSDDDAGLARRRWGRYASIVSRSSHVSRASCISRRGRASGRSRAGVSRASGRSRPNVEILAKTREWGEIDDSSSDDEMPGGLDRHERYARLAQEMEAEAKGVKADSPEESARGSRWLCFTCCMFCILQNSINFSLLVLIAELRNLAVVCCLAPSAVFLTFLEACLASTDRSIVHERYRVRRSNSSVRLLAFEVFVFVVLGCLHGYRLMRAYRHWMGIDPQGTFLTELETLDPTRKSWVGRRWDSHYLLWSVPTVVCLTCSLTLGSFDFPQDLFWCSVLAFAIFEASVSVESFDYATSHQVRTWHGMVFDKYQWTENNVDEGQTKRLQRLHRMARGCEVFGRVLVIVAVSAMIPYYPGCAAALLVADYSVCFLALWSNSGLTLEVPVVSVALLLADIARYVDEPGFVLPASRVSRVLDAMRLLELVLAVAACALTASGALGPSLAGWAVLLLVLLVLVHALCLTLRRILGKGRRSDLFVAVLNADLDAVEHSLSFEGGCTVDMIVCDGTQQTALHLAAACGHLECVRYLLKNGAKCSATDANLENPLHIAVRRRNLGLARLLLQEEEEADPEAVHGRGMRQVFMMVKQMNCKGETPQDLLGKRAAPEMRELLEKVAAKAAQADLNARVRIPRMAGQESERTDSNLSRSTPTSSRTPTGSVVHAVSSSLLNNLYGTIVGGEHFNIQAGPREKVQRAELAAFMFFRGMGEQLQRLHRYFRHSKRRQAGSSKVQVSDLRTVATLGAGGFGKVLKVEDVRSGNFYALKLQCRNKTTKQAVREAQALSAASLHPYIVQLVQIFRTSAFYGILMEFCDKDLNKRILETESTFGRVEGLSHDITARYTACVMFALEYLHGNSIVFRDLKPENVLIVAKDDHAKLTDFGLARTIEQEVNDDGMMMTPQMSMAAGTLGFMSSEAFNGSPEDDDDEERGTSWFLARDWYSLGCCVLLMILGEGGGRKVYAAHRHVLLPAPQGEILDLLMKAMDAEQITDDAFDLVSSLTAAQVTERADAKKCRSNAFLQAAIAELEPVGLEQ